jgi:hypothetical protein
VKTLIPAKSQRILVDGFTPCGSSRRPSTDAAPSRSGVCEFPGAIAVKIRTTRQRTGIGTALLTNGVTPANLHMVVNAIAGPTGVAALIAPSGGAPQAAMSGSWPGAFGTQPWRNKHQPGMRKWEKHDHGFIGDHQ